MTTIKGWDPVAAGKEAGRNERMMRHQSPRMSQYVARFSFQDWVANKADKGGRYRQLDEDEVLAEGHKRETKFIAESFALKVIK